MIDEDDFSSLLGKLPKFSADQRKQVLLRLKQQSQINNDNAAPNDTSLHDDWLLLGICSALRARGLLTKMSLFALTQTTGYKAYLKVNQSLMRELSLLLPERSRSQARASLAQLVGVALIKWCEKSLTVAVYDEEHDRHVRQQIRPVSPSYVLKHAASAFEAIELCYPGYLDANLFHVLIGGFDGTHEHREQSAARSQRVRRTRGE